MIGPPKGLPLSPWPSQKGDHENHSAYVVDCSFTNANIEKIARLAKDADILFIEATFLEADAALAKARHHLTARQAGTIARLAGVKRLVTLHHSPRYKETGHRLAEEARDAFVSG